MSRHVVAELACGDLFFARLLQPLPRLVDRPLLTVMGTGSVYSH
jgi:hypothetical protein